MDMRITIPLADDRLSPQQIVDSGGGELQAGRHGAIRAVSTLYRALAEYLLNL